MDNLTPNPRKGQVEELKEQLGEALLDKKIINIIFSILFLIVGMLLAWGTNPTEEEDSL